LISSERPLKKSIPVKDSILSILVAKDFKLELLPLLFKFKAMAIFSDPLSLKKGIGNIINSFKLVTNCGVQQPLKITGRYRKAKRVGEK